MMTAGFYLSPLGRMILTSDHLVLSGLAFEDQKHFTVLRSPLPPASSLPVFRDTVRWLDIYFEGRDPGFTPAHICSGTAFRRSVWEILLDIPFGKTVTYGQIAAVLAERQGIPHMSAQAVGQAVGRNPIALIIPCHRVLGADGSLTGYAGGLDRKRRLLCLEHYMEADMPSNAEGEAGNA